VNVIIDGVDAVKSAPRRSAGTMGAPFDVRQEGKKTKKWLYVLAMEGTKDRTNRRVW
jgi:hypothetical protein